MTTSRILRQFEPDIKDLRILDIDPESMSTRLIVNSVVAVGIAVPLALGLSVGVGVRSVLLFVGLLCAAPVIGIVAFTSRIKRTAETARMDMDLTVAVFLDLINVLIAGGSGIETAMLTAANAGDGASFDAIRLALARAQSSRTSYWTALRELGSATGVSSLEDVANCVQLAGEHGARVRLTLAAKGRALRSSNLARIEHDAEQRTEHMGLPVVLMFLGFVVLIGYPAFISTIGAL